MFRFVRKSTAKTTTFVTLLIRYWTSDRHMLHMICITYGYVFRFLRFYTKIAHVEFCENSFLCDAYTYNTVYCYMIPYAIWSHMNYIYSFIRFIQLYKYLQKFTISVFRLTLSNGSIQLANKYINNILPFNSLASFSNTFVEHISNTNVDLFRI